ncbi:hypothetical protein ACROYT_G000894 [Oculina patagonica]
MEYRVADTIISVAFKRLLSLRNRHRNEKIGESPSCDNAVSLNSAIEGCLEQKFQSEGRRTRRIEEVIRSSLLEILSWTTNKKFYKPSVYAH